VDGFAKFVFKLKKAAQKFSANFFVAGVFQQMSFSISF
jgi:hypothetical protein